jgi:hypothetical protein
MIAYMDAQDIQDKNPVHLVYPCKLFFSYITVVQDLSC